jgi:hypothetical protein
MQNARAALSAAARQSATCAEWSSTHGLFDEIGHALVLLSNSEQPRPDLEEPGPRGLFSESRRPVPIAMRVGKSGLHCPLPTNPRLNAIALDVHLMTFPVFYARSRFVLFLSQETDRALRHCHLQSTQFLICISISDKAANATESLPVVGSLLAQRNIYEIR